MGSTYRRNTMFTLFRKNANVARLKEILSTMSVPKERKNLVTENLRWLAANLLLNNANHPDVHEAKDLTKAIIVARRKKLGAFR